MSSGFPGYGFAWYLISSVEAVFAAKRVNGTVGLAVRGLGVTTIRRTTEQSQEAILAFAAEQPESFFLEGLGGPSETQPERCDAGQQWPQTFMVRLSGRCNLACDYCFDSANCAPSDHLDQPTAERIADYILAVPGNKPLISFLGGEPLVNWSVGSFLINTIRLQGMLAGKRSVFQHRHQWHPDHERPGERPGRAGPYRADQY